MATPYCTEQDIGDVIGRDVRDTLADFDLDGSADSGIIGAAITRADRKINARLGRAYVVPFASLPDTPELIRTVSAHMAAVELFAQSHADGIDLDYHRREAGDMIEGVLSGKLALVGADRLPVEERSTLVVVDSGDPTFAGIDPDSGRSNMSGW